MSKKTELDKKLESAKKESKEEDVEKIELWLLIIVSNFNLKHSFHALQHLIL